MVVKEAIPGVGPALAVAKSAGTIDRARKAVGRAPRPAKVGVVALTLATTLGLLGRCEGVLGLNEVKDVRAASLAKLTLATTIPEEVAVAREVAHYGGISAADSYKVCATPNKLPLVGGLLPSGTVCVTAASWSVSYSGDIGAKVLTKQAIGATEVYDPKAPRRDHKGVGAFVINLTQNDFVLDVYEMEPGLGFVTHNSPIAAEITNFENDLKVIPGVNAPGIDHKYDGLRHEVINEAFREMAAPQGCGHLGIDYLTHPTNVDADSQLAQPKTIQGVIIKNLVQEDNKFLKATHSNYQVTSYDFDVNVTAGGGPVALPTEYTEFSNGLSTHKKSGWEIPKESAIHACQPATGMGT